MKSVIILSIFLIPSFVFCQSSIDKKHEKIESIFIGHITGELNLTPEESREFWPIYNAYRTASDEAKKKSHSYRNHGELTSDAEALQLLNDHLSGDQKRLELKRKLYKDLSSIISPLRILKLKSAEHEFRRQMFDRIKENKGI